jgi:GDP-L-fucose synthase
MLANKRILVTGGNGFLGKHIINKLLKHGVRRSTIFAPHSGDLNLCRQADCETAVKNIDIVIHAAGITGNAEFHRSQPGRIFYENLIMGVQLMEAARLANVEKFITVGSAAEYPQKASMPLREQFIWSGFPEAIHAPYAIAKKMLLVQAQAYRAQYGFNAIHLLVTGMYGPGEKLDGGPIPALITKVLQAKQNNERIITMWGTGKPTRDFLYVEDAAEAIILATEKYDKPEPVNIGTGVEITIKDLVQLICRLMDYKGEIKWDLSKPDGQPRRVLDVSRAEREFGFKAKTNFEEGLKKTIAWYVEQNEQ